MKVVTLSNEDETLLHGLLDDAVFDLDIFIDQYYNDEGKIDHLDKVTREQLELDVMRKNALQNLDYRISNAKYPATRKMKRDMGLIPDEL